MKLNYFGIKIKEGLKMYKKFLFNILFLLPSIIFAHTLVLNVSDNEDNTISVVGAFNTGQSASGAQIRLESLVSGEILYQKRLPDESELTIAIPKEPYQIVLDGGPGHQSVKKGIPPKEGFNKELIKKTKQIELSKPRSTIQGMGLEMVIAVGFAFLLLFITIIISIKNTNKIIKEIKKSKN